MITGQSYLALVPPTNSAISPGPNPPSPPTTPIPSTSDGPASEAQSSFAIHMDILEDVEILGDEDGVREQHDHDALATPHVTATEILTGPAGVVRLGVRIAIHFLVGNVKMK